MILTKDRFEQKTLNVSPKPSEWVQAFAKVTVTAEIAGLRKDGQIDLFHLSDYSNISLEMPSYTDTEVRNLNYEELRIGGEEMDHYKSEVVQHLVNNRNVITAYCHTESGVDFFTVLINDEDVNATIEISTLYCELLDKFEGKYEFRFYPIPSTYFNVTDLPEGAVKCVSGGHS